MMAERCQVLTRSYEGEGKIKGGKSELRLEYNQTPSISFVLVLMGIIGGIGYALFFVGEPFSAKKVLAAMVVCFAVYLFLSLIGKIFPFINGLFFKSEIVDLGRDVITVKYGEDETESFSGVGVISGLGAAGMSGALRSEGKRAGSNIWMALALMSPVTKRKTESHVSFLKVDGEALVVSCKKRLANKIVDSVEPIPDGHVKDFIKYYDDLKRFPGRAEGEIEAKLGELEDQAYVLMKQVNDSESVTDRSRASRSLKNVDEEMRVFERLLELSRDKTGTTPDKLSKKYGDNGEKKKSVSRASVWSAIFGLFSVFVFPAPVAILTGVIGFNDARKNGKKWGFLSLIGIGLGVLWMALFVTYWVQKS